MKERTNERTNEPTNERSKHTYSPQSWLSCHRCRCLHLTDEQVRRTNEAKILILLSRRCLVIVAAAATFVSVERSSKLLSSDPSSNPSETPSSDPSELPSSDPSSNPSETPSSNPTDTTDDTARIMVQTRRMTRSHPLSNQSELPSSDPSSNPSDTPSSDPTEGLTADATLTASPGTQLAKRKAKAAVIITAYNKCYKRSCWGSNCSNCEE